MEAIKNAIQCIDELEHIAISGEYHKFLQPVKEFSKCVMQSSFSNPQIVKSLKNALISVKNTILNPSDETLEIFKENLQSVKVLLTNILDEDQLDHSITEDTYTIEQNAPLNVNNESKETISTIEESKSDSLISHPNDIELDDQNNFDSQQVDAFNQLYLKLEEELSEPINIHIQQQSNDSDEHEELSEKKDINNTIYTYELNYEEIDLDDVLIQKEQEIRVKEDINLNHIESTQEIDKDEFLKQSEIIEDLKRQLIEEKRKNESLQAYYELELRRQAEMYEKRIKELLEDCNNSYIEAQSLNIEVENLQNAIKLKNEETDTTNSNDHQNMNHHFNVTDNKDDTFEIKPTNHIKELVEDCNNSDIVTQSLNIEVENQQNCIELKNEETDTTNSNDHQNMNHVFDFIDNKDDTFEIKPANHIKELVEDCNNSDIVTQSLNIEVENQQNGIELKNEETDTTNSNDHQNMNHHFNVTDNKDDIFDIKPTSYVLTENDLYRLKVLKCLFSSHRPSFKKIIIDIENNEVS